MGINTTRWNRIRYGIAAPVYDVFFAPLQALGFAAARRRAMDMLSPKNGAKLLIVGAGTGLDLACIPPGVSVVATDLSPWMIRAASRRARRLGRNVEVLVMDGEELSFPDNSFDHVVLHLILAVMPDPYACAREVGRVLKPGGTVSVFDKFVPEGESPSRLRRFANLFANAAFSDLTRALGPILESGGLHVIDREPAILNLFTLAIAGHAADPCE